jgi:RHS repeat-associated protein
LNLTYNYLDAGNYNNGQIQSVTDSRGAAFSTSYSYDSLGRLQQAQTNDLTAANTWRLAWTYDRYGNRLSQTLTGGTMSVGQPQLTVDPATNHISTAGFSYDANGNLTQDTAGAYTFDADNRMTQSVVGSTTATYAYDGHRWRVQKTVSGSTTTYVYAGSKVIAEYIGGSLSKEYIYSGGKLLATVAGSTVTYHHPDHLSNRVETDGSGAAIRTFGQLPFGETWYETGTTDKWKFTSYERDGESGLDYAMHRSYNSGYGRFQTPDLLGGSLVNPQSLNRYGYVANDPINMADPLGLYLILMTTTFDCTWFKNARTGAVEASSCQISINFQNVDDGSGGGGGHGGGGGGKSTAPGIDEARKRLLNKLCKDLFKNSGVDPSTLLDNLDNNGLIQISDSYPKPGNPAKRDHFETGNIGAETTQGAASYPLPTDHSIRVSAPIITINQNGFYFSGRMTNLTPVNDLGEFSGLDIGEVQAAVIIHELLHAAGAVKPDGDDPAASQQISQDVYNNCFKSKNK